MVPFLANKSPTPCLHTAKCLRQKCELGTPGSALRVSISLVVIGFALGGLAGNAAAQYLSPQPPPVGYSPPASYPYPAGPPRYQGAYPDSDPYQDSDPYDDSYDQPYAPRPPREVYPPPASYPYSAGPPRYLGGYPYSDPGASPSQDRGTAVAALPPEYQPERAPAKELPPQFHRTVVDYPTIEPPGTIIIDTPNTYLYLTIGHGKAIRYGIGVGREGFTWSGTERISRMKEWPDWLPPKEMIKRQPYLPRFMAGGETNPLGARAMYLGNTEYRIHGTNQPSTIGTFVSSGCIRLTNEDVEDLYSRVTVGTTVIVLPGANTAASQLRPRY
jgi:lipoprotein-anchoring transpeptidase ErfK/SrfK